MDEEQKRQDEERRRAAMMAALSAPAPNGTNSFGAATNSTALTGTNATAPRTVGTNNASASLIQTDLAAGDRALAALTAERRRQLGASSFQEQAAAGFTTGASSLTQLNEAGNEIIKGPEKLEDLKGRASDPFTVPGKEETPVTQLQKDIASYSSLLSQIEFVDVPDIVQAVQAPVDPNDQIRKDLLKAFITDRLRQEPSGSDRSIDAMRTALGVRPVTGPAVSEAIAATRLPVGQPASPVVSPAAPETRPSAETRYSLPNSPNAASDQLVQTSPDNANDPYRRLRVSF